MKTDVCRLSDSCWCSVSKRATVTWCNTQAWKIITCGRLREAQRDKLQKEKQTSIKTTERTLPRLSGPNISAATFELKKKEKEIVLAQQSFKHQIHLNPTHMENLDMFFDLTDGRLSPYVWRAIRRKIEWGNIKKDGMKSTARTQWIDLQWFSI